MRRRWIRNRPDRRENAMAAVAAAGVGAVVGAVLFYLGRLFLAREPVRPQGQVEAAAGEETALQEGKRA